MVERPLISVIVPVYNVRKYLRECIESLKHQTYKYLEVIIVDDGSSDGSEDICDLIAEDNPSFKVFHKENGGLSDARNYGVEKATGSYISFLDSDDVLSPIFYDAVVCTIEKYDVDLVTIRQPIYYWDGEPLHLTKSFEACHFDLYDAETALRKMLYLQIATGAPFKIIKKELINDIRFPTGYYYEDIATTYKYFLKTDKVAVISGDLYGYRKRNDSIIREKFTQRKLCIIDISTQIINDFSIHYDGKLLAAARYRVFPPLFSVYLQIPFEQKDYRKTIWTEIVKYRRRVLFTMYHIRFKDRIAAFISYFGMNTAYFIGRKYGRKGTFN